MSDLPPELQSILSQIGSRPAEDNEDDPPVWQSGYWDYDESTGKEYFVNYGIKKPKSQADLDFYKLNRDELRRFQELAYQAGYYGSSAERGDVPFGAYDDTTAQLWEQLNGRAAKLYKTGKMSTVWDVLQDDVENRPENLGKNQGQKRAPLVTELPDPREIQVALMELGPSIIGREPDEAFINDFTAMYTQMVKEFQENKYALESSEEGGTITAPPSAESLARFRLRYERPEQYEEKAGAVRHNAYLSLLKGAL